MQLYTPSERAIARFNRFKSILARELGERVSMTHDGFVIVHANEFSRECKFNSLQAAIDSYARFLPVEFANPNQGER